MLLQTLKSNRLKPGGQLTATIISVQPGLQTASLITQIRKFIILNCPENPRMFSPKLRFYWISFVPQVVCTTTTPILQPIKVLKGSSNAAYSPAPRTTTQMIRSWDYAELRTNLAWEELPHLCTMRAMYRDSHKH